MNLGKVIKEFINHHYLLLLSIALVLAVLSRFVKLGSNTLSDNEAQQALQAFNLVKGQSTLISGQPGYVGLTSFLFFLFGSSTFFARFWPALFGAGLVFMPVLFRKNLEDSTGIILAFILALEPGLVALSRTADGTMITITAMIAAIGFLLNKKLILAGIFLGLSILGSGNFWPLLILVGLTWLIIGEKKLFRKEGIEKSRWWVFVFSAFITILLISTQYLLKPNGVSGIGSSLVDYWRSWHQVGTISLGNLLLIYLSTQFPAIILGVWGLIRGLKLQSPLSRFLGLWWAFGLVLELLNPSHNVWSLVLLDLPLFVLAAMQIMVVIEGLISDSKVLTLIESAVTLGLIVFSTLNFLNMINFPPGDPNSIRDRLIGTLLPLALWIAFTSLLAWGWDTSSTKSGLLLALGLLLFALLVGSGWKAASLGSRPENEFFTNPGYITGEPDLIQTMTDVARWNAGFATSIDVDVVGLNSPSVMWVVRNFEKVTTDSAFPVTTTPSIVISGSESAIQSQTLYRGQPVVWSLQPDFSQMLWQDWIKWHFMRMVPQTKNNVILWVRNDLFKDSTSQQNGK